MFAAKNHETSKTKAEKPLAQANAKGEKSERVQANPLWNQLATRVQAKLIVGTCEDPCEREADRVADKLMAASPNPAVRGTPPRIQRFAGNAIGETGMAPVSVDRALANSGRPLEPALRQDMEQRFGHDFSRVRLHSGASGEQSARDVNAHAYTVGHDIVFGAGRFAPETHEGRRLLAHELAHVVQQSGADGNRLDQNNEGCGGSSISQALAERDTVARRVQRQPTPPAEIEAGRICRQSR